ncbi:DNA polymerase III subunit gamma/tau [Candidatus Parcubacteria bacterium]|nr:MAG: DNA polymerase III subunit gamma/tau [Candidatus Parcubacteria bacterium]
MTTVLYRKYRPRGFEDVLGQDHIVSVLKNAVKSGRVAHAYLFAGTRGTGKTSLARILAKEAGCADEDLLEIDAASSRGIDEIRALREAVRFSPLRGKVKVYIIDEAHMLTKEAFNALLKTLEEPPAHAIFILATTELEKVPETILSRCQNFSFRKIPENLLKKSITDIAEKEGFKIDDEAAGIVALMAEGSFRDSQRTLDQILSLGNKEITGEMTREFLSVPARAIVENFIESVLDKDAEKGLEAIRLVAEKNINFAAFLKLLLRDIRSMILLKHAPTMKKNIQDIHGEKEFAFLEKLKGQAKPGELEKALKILLECCDSKNQSYLPQIPLELALLKILS